MAKSTVEMIIALYGVGREIRTYKEKKRVPTEEYLDVEPLAFSLNDEGENVLSIYIDTQGWIPGEEQATEQTLPGSTEQVLNLTEREMNIVRYSLEQERDRLAKELITATNLWGAASEKGLSKGASRFRADMESARRKINEVSELLKKI